MVDVREDGSVVIYFFGVVVFWCVVLGGMFGDCVVISGLCRKIIWLGFDNKEFCIYVVIWISLVFCIGFNCGV